MRRLLAITITLLLSFTLAAPLFVIDSANSLPECCRRNGRHHCATMSGSTESSFTTIGARCAAFPKPSALPALHSFALSMVSTTRTELFVHPSASPQTEARYRIAFARSRQKRGPPAAPVAS
jgi:hypothetical protein